MVDIVRCVNIDHCLAHLDEGLAGHLEAQVGLAGSRSPTDLHYLVARDRFLQVSIESIDKINLGLKIRKREFQLNFPRKILNLTNT